MSEEYSLEIVNPEKSFLLKDDVTEVIDEVEEYANCDFKKDRRDD